jgi:superfamily II DNA/RNA helicase
LIQDRAIPEILQGKDLIGIANTGTGKTASFLIPLIQKIIKDRNEKVLIVLPTRELALQIVDELNAFARSLNINSALCIGGSSMSRQIYALKRNPNFVIGTPGRLKDLINRNLLRVPGFTNVVLDEVDRMLDMGFVHDIKHLISLLPAKRQSLFFSATVSREVDNLIMGFVKNPVKISVKSGETADNIEQDIVRVKDKTKKIETLHDLLIKEEFKKVLIFGRTKRGVEHLSRSLHERGFKVGSIHGNKSQSQREKVLSLFKANHLQTLVATDVAARGLDIVDITHVINYDPPATYDDYVHRIGRTGRANKIGKALTFIG